MILGTGSTPTNRCSDVRRFEVDHPENSASFNSSPSRDGTARHGDRKVSKEKPAVNPFGPGRSIQALFAAFLISVALYLARVVFEPIAFALFGMALVRPFQKALEAKLPKSVALGLTVLLALLAILALAAVIVLRQLSCGALMKSFTGV